MSGTGQAANHPRRSQGNVQNVGYGQNPIQSGTPGYALPVAPEGYMSPQSGFQQQYHIYNQQGSYQPNHYHPIPFGYQQSHMQSPYTQQQYIQSQPYEQTFHTRHQMSASTHVPPHHQLKKERKALRITDPSTGKDVNLESAIEKTAETPQPQRHVVQQFANSVKEKMQEEATRSKQNSICEEVKAAIQQSTTAEAKEDVAMAECVTKNSESEKVRVSEPTAISTVVEEVKEDPVEEHTSIEETKEVLTTPVKPSQASTPEASAGLNVSNEISVSPEIAEESEPSPSPPLAESPEAPEEEEVDEEAKAREVEEKKQLREVELMDKIAAVVGTEEVDEQNGCYGREFLVLLRTLEKEFKKTRCPLTPEQLNGFGLDINAMVKKPFATIWQQAKPTRPNNGMQNYQYKGRNTTDGTGRGGYRHDKGNNKKPPTNRGSIERMPKSQLPSSKTAWKPPSKLRESEDISEEEKKIRETCKAARSLMNKITPTTFNKLAQEFLSYKVYENSNQLNSVVEIIFDKAVEEPKFGELYAQLCKDVVNYEISENREKKSKFRDALLQMAQKCFQARLEEDIVKQRVIEEEDPDKRAEAEAKKKDEINKLRRRKFGNMTFIGFLYRQQVLSQNIIGACIKELFITALHLKENPNAEQDEESIQCGIQLIEVCGKICDTNFNRSFLDQWFGIVRPVIKLVSNKIKFMILNVLELRENNWVPRKSVDTGPKKITDIHKDAEKEKAENERAREQYERKQLRTGGNSLRKNPPTQRNSYDRRKVPQGDTKSAVAAVFAASSKNSSSGSNRKLSSIDDDNNRLGSRKRWSNGAAGGGGGNDAPTTQTGGWKNSDGFSQAIAAAKSLGSGNLDSRKSASQTSLAESVPDSAENAERQENLKRLTKRIKGDIEEVVGGEFPLEEVSVVFIKEYIGSEKYGKPSHEEFYELTIRSATQSGMKADLRKVLGHVLCHTISNKEDGEKFITGVTNFTITTVNDSDFLEENPNTWLVTAEVLYHTMYAPQDIGTNYRLTLADFQNPILESMKDARSGKKFDLLVNLLKLLAEHEIKENSSLTEAQATHMELSGSGILEKVEQDELHERLEKCNMSTGASLASLLQL